MVVLYQKACQHGCVGFQHRGGTIIVRGPQQILINFGSPQSGPLPPAGAALANGLGSRSDSLHDLTMLGYDSASRNGIIQPNHVKYVQLGRMWKVLSNAAAVFMMPKRLACLHQAAQ